MDHVVHINNGSGGTRPIVLRLLPGEETIFNLKVVNHGEPSNISLQASSPVLKAVRLKKPDHYVVMEEIIPILARMPAHRNRLDGEILLSGSAGESRVPITLLRDSEDPGEDQEDPGLQGAQELRGDLMEDKTEGEDGGDEDGDEEEDEEYPAGRKRGRNAGDDEDDEDAGEDAEEDEEKEPRRIAFSKDRDLERYRAAGRRRQGASAAESVGYNDRNDDRNNGNEDPDRSSSSKGSRLAPRYSTRIDDSFIDKKVRPDESQPASRREAQPDKWDAWPENAEAKAEPEPELEPEPEARLAGSRPPSAFAEERREAQPGGYPGGVSRQPTYQAGVDALAEDGPQDYAGEPPGEDEPEGREAFPLLDRLGGYGGQATMQVIPAAIFLALVAALVLTFITESIPEFPGALASSILIVTLIIYGAATLLKA
jgi:hypothetical protein